MRFIHHMPFISDTRRNLGILLFMTLLLAACSSSHEKSKAGRAELAAHAKGPIYIAIAWPFEDESHPFPKGVFLAVDEINNAGGVLGRKLEPVLFNATEEGAHAAARKIAANDNIVAVIGHNTSAAAITASITYEENGILFLAPSATNPALTAHNFEYVFRTTPSDTVMGRGLARFAHRRGYRRMIILDDNSIFGTGLADIFYAEAVDLDIDIISHKAYFQWQTDYKSQIAEFSKIDFDAVFLAGLMPNAAWIIQQFRAMGMQEPFIAGDGLDVPTLSAVAGAAAERTVVPTVFNPGANDPRVREFTHAFQKKYNAVPQTWEAIGYDTVKLLAFTFKRCESTVPAIVASTLRFTEGWPGVTGDFTFDRRGDLTRETVYFKEMENGRFEFIKE